MLSKPTTISWWESNSASLHQTQGASLERVAASEVLGHYAWADTTVVSLRNWGPFEWTVPSKLYELMATGKHVTALLAGEAAGIAAVAEVANIVPPVTSML